MAEVRHWSAGLLLFRRRGAALEVLLGRADAALYRAKGEGRNRTMIAP